MKVSGSFPHSPAISAYREKHPSNYQVTFQFKQDVFIGELANIMKHWSADATPENGI